MRLYIFMSYVYKNKLIRVRNPYTRIHIWDYSYFYLYIDLAARHIVVGPSSRLATLQFDGFESIEVEDVQLSSNLEPMI